MSQSPCQGSELAARNQEWATLITGVVNRDEAALAKLYDSSNRLIYGLLLRILGNAATAEEVLFDVYTQVWQQATRYDNRRGNPGAWLITMARSRAIDRLRSDRRLSRYEEPLEDAPSARDQSDSQGITFRQELGRVVSRAVDTLRAEEREVIELAFYSGLTHSEMATRLNQPLGTIKTRARRGMIKLRELLGPALEGTR
jgi:RNA polymerase sigma-70 factor (ECF subfamily)